MSKIQGKQINLDTNPSLGTSDRVIPSQYAIKQYVDTMVAASTAVIYTATIPANTPSPFVINHGLNSYNYFVNVYDDVTKEDIVVNIDRLDENNVEISYGSNPNNFKVLIFSTGVVAELGTNGGSTPSEGLNIIPASSNFLVTEDQDGSIIEANGTFNIQFNSVPTINMKVDIINIGSGQITLTSTGTLHSKAGATKLLNQYGGCSVYFNKTTGVWYAMGDLST